MNLSDILGRDQIIPQLRAVNKRQAIEVLVDCLVETGRLVQAKREVAMDRIVRREQQAPTGLILGMALPLCDMEGIHSPVCALGHLDRPIDYRGIDDQPVNTLLLLVRPVELDWVKMMGLAQQLRGLLIQNAVSLATTTDKDTLWELVQIR